MMKRQEQEASTETNLTSADRNHLITDTETFIWLPKEEELNCKTDTPSLYLSVHDIFHQSLS